MWTYRGGPPTRRRKRVRSGEGGTESAPPADRAIDILEFARKLRFEPEELQRQLLTSEAKRRIVNCTRQWGKSTIAAIQAVHRAYTRPGSLVLIASPSERQSAEFLRKAAEMVASLGITPRGDGDSTTSLLLPNGSRIVGLPGTEGTVRGYSAVSLLVIDEAARVPDAMYKALRPMLAVGRGDVWLMSTPYGKRGFFYHVWAHGGEEWLRVSVAATECEHIEKTFLDEERSQLGTLWFEQEYMCQFVDNGMAVFGQDLVDDAMDEDLDPLF